MSRLSNSRVHARVDRSAVTAQLWRCWPRAVLLQRRRVDVVTVPGTRDEALRAAANQAVGDLAADGRALRGAMHIELCDSLLHLDVTQGRFAGRSARQLKSFAQGWATELLGDAAAGHELRWQLQRDEQSLLVCAMPQALVDIFAATASAAGLTLASVQPSFAIEWNRHARAMGLRDVVFAVASAGHTVVAFVRRGVVTAINHGPAIDAGIHHNNSEPGKHPFDAHVDTLFASLGLDEDTPLPYVLAGTTASAAGLASRWSVVKHEGALA